MTVARRIARRTGSSFLTHGGDDYDHKGLNRARRDEAKAIIREWEPTTEESPAPAPQPTTFRVVVQTQVYENYGTHCCDCETDETCTCHPYWKAKGGSEYQQPIGSANDVLELGSAGIQKTVNAIAEKVTRNDRFYEENVINWQIVPNTEETSEERMLREMHEDGYLAPGARTEDERTAYYTKCLEDLRKPVL